MRRKAGHEVEVFEMAPQAGGRARTVQVAGHALDNGQHILIGAYQATLELMREVGADTATLLRRLPLALQYPDGQGLALRQGAPGAGLRARGAGAGRAGAGAIGWRCWLPPHAGRRCAFVAPTA